MSTFLELQDQTIAELTSLLQVDSALLPRTLVKAWINDGYTAVQSAQIWPWSIKDGTDTLTIASTSLSPPAHFGAMLGAYNTPSGREMVFTASRQAWTENEDDISASVAHYRRVGNTWTVWPTPDAAEVIKMRYVYIWTALSADADVPVMPALYHRILR